ncbi:ABC-type multidrug transport system ATPase subunit [Methanohalophilus levihalophilus]|uniref:ABC transporter ATP-binding protein n=1 Tax=Methanohalophilus levihalophilus TaxID=1431282 RepID=UPI001AE84CC4|nr:ABC transporter ATP-binding protein [Methanohalophilus levihalophilus]MBP2029157.1 ABC-type multidrug transport system ATPase subunit [Methanohalophilus levihalophilus]
MDDLIVAKALAKNYGRITAVDNIDLRIRAGEFVAITGPNGAGKSTLLKLLSARLHPSSGEILINGISLSDDEMGIRKEFGVLSHESYLYDELNAIENLHFFGNLYDLEGMQLEDQIEMLLDETGLWKRATDRVSTYSRGMKQRLSFARALIHDPGVLFLDEPFSGLDPGASKIMEQLLVRKSTTTRLLVTHNIDFAISICDRILVMDSGKLVADFESKDESVRETIAQICGINGCV